MKYCDLRNNYFLFSVIVLAISVRYYLLSCIIRDTHLCIRLQQASLFSVIYKYLVHACLLSFSCAVQSSSVQLRLVLLVFYSVSC